MTKGLVIGEKTSQVKAFVQTLSSQSQKIRHSKYIYEYNCQWINSFGNIYDFTFLPLSGHITSIDTRKGYGWGEIAPIKLVIDPEALVIKNQSLYVKILIKLIQDKEELWLATDPDSEGDNIALEVVTILNKQLNKNKIKIKRVWNNSLTQNEIIRAFENPLLWNENLALSVQGRRLVDAWLGFAGTREITRSARKVAKVKVFSIGRVQLPTLNLIVKRDVSIETFNPQERYKLQLLWSIEKEEKMIYKSEYKGGLFPNISELNKIKDKILNEKGNASIEVIGVKKQEISKIPPIPLNTTASISLLCKLLKISAKRALDLMVSLYNKGLLSYPRTENTKFKDKFPHKDILSLLIAKKELLPLIIEIKNNSQVRNNGKKKDTIEDHDPIHPTGELKSLNILNNLEKRTWEILTLYYISLFLDDFIYSTTNYDLGVNDVSFTSQSKMIKEIGWHKAQNWLNFKEEFLPSLSVGDILYFVDIKISQSFSKPPPRYNDSQIILEMEKLNIGTKSSRADIIKKLEDRNYIKRIKTNLVSTPWGRVLIASLSPIWPDVISPRYTAHIEDIMDLVASGDKNYDYMIENLRKNYIDLHKKLLTKLSDYQKLLTDLNLHSQKEIDLNQRGQEILLELLENEPISNFDSNNDFNS